MNYRLYTADDFDKVDKLCERYNMPFPEGNQFLVIAEDDEGNIVAICGLKQEWKIEPLIAENPIAGNVLFRQVEGIAMGQGIRVLYAEIPKENEKHLNHAKKAGFKIISDNRIVLEKKYNE